MKFKLLDKLIMLSKYSLKGVLLQCLLLNAIWAADINAQEVKSVNDVSLNLKVENASLSELFQVIEKSTNFYFSFSSEDISKDFTYTKNKRNITVRDVLLEVSEKANLKFKQVNRNIIVQKNNSDKAKPEIEVVIQGITITGKVTSSEDNVGLPGANVIVKGTGTGTVTDIQGNYSLEVPDENVTIVFSSVGYTTVEVLVGTQAVIDIAMNVDVTSLEEIVVVGYGTQKKITVTGAVVDVKGDELIKSPAIDMTNSIAGRLPGVVAIQTGGEPGYDGSDIKIRGTNTLGNADPLIVIDGIPDRDGGFGRLSPQDVESISVLKDASAAIYGSRAANGAIIITTKRGATGKPTVNFDMNFGWAQPVRVPEMSNAGEYARIMNELPIYQNVDVADWEAAWQSISTTGTYTYPDNTVLNANYHPDDIAIHEDGSDPWGHPDTDWFGDAFKTWAPQSRYNFTLSGGAPKVKYFASLGYIFQDAIYKNSATYYKQYNARVNLDADISDYLKVTLGVMMRREDRNFPTESRGSIFRMLMRGRPVEPEVWPTGEPGPDIENGQNPYVVTTNATGYEKDPTDYLQTNGSLIITQPWVEGLKLTLSGAVDYHSRYTKRWQTPWTLYNMVGRNPDGTGILEGAIKSNFTDPRLQEQYRHVLNTNLTAILNYDKTWDDHTLNILAGVTKEQFKGNDFLAYRRNYISPAVDQLFAGGSVGQNTDGSAYERARLGTYGRFQYNYKEKYLAEFIWRYDGSYIFPESDRFGFFPGLLVGWNITNENWFDVSSIDYLKIRASYGEMGNDYVAIYQDEEVDGTNIVLQEYAFLSTYDFGEYPINSIVQTTLVEALLANPNFTWERQNNYNVGVDVTLFGGRVDLTLEWFKNVRDNMLIQATGSTPASSGISSLLPPENRGKMENQGYEFDILYNHSGSQVQWNAGINGGYAKNKVIFMDEVPGIPQYQKKEGKPLDHENDYLLYQYDGVYLNQQEVEAETLDYSNVTSQLLPGDMKFKDVDGNGVIDADDRVQADYNREPTFNYGATFNLQWKNFDFSLLLQGATGAKFFIYTESGDIGNFLKDDHDNRWSIDNPSSEHPRLVSRSDRYYAQGNFRNDYYMFSKNYLRLKNIELGYNIPLGNQQVVQRLRIYVNALNLVTWDTNKIFDPESDNPAGTYYPQSRVINTGLSITF